MNESKMLGPCEKPLRARPRPVRLTAVMGYVGRVVIQLRDATGPRRLTLDLQGEDARRMRVELARPAVELRDAVLVLLDAFALQDRSGFTPAQREALDALELAKERIDARAERADQDQAIAAMREASRAAIDEQTRTLIAEIRRRDGEGNVIPDHLYAQLERALGGRIA